MKIYFLHFRFSDSLKSPFIKALGKDVKIIDSTIIGLFQYVLRNVGRRPVNGKKKGGIKLHTTIENGIPIPPIHYISEATMHDNKVFKKMELEKESIYVFDKGYTDYEKWATMNEQGIFFVCRMKENSIYKSVEEKDVSDKSHPGILKDEIIEKEYGKEGKKLKLRKVAYWDDKNKICYEFITNLMDIEVD